MRTILNLAIVALIATSSCSSSDSSSEPGSELPADVDAWRATITDDFINRRGAYSPETQTRWEQESHEEAADGFAFRIEFYPDPLEYEQLGDPFVTGNGPWFVTIRQRWIALSEPDSIVFEGNATYVVVERDGAMKVDAEYLATTMDFVED